MPDELLTVKEVAERLKLNQQTIRNMIDRGELGHVRVGQRRVRVRQSQLDAFLPARQRGSRRGDRRHAAETLRLNWTMAHNAALKASAPRTLARHSRCADEPETLLNSFDRRGNGTSGDKRDL